MPKILNLMRNQEPSIMYTSLQNRSEAFKYSSERLSIFKLPRCEFFCMSNFKTGAFSLALISLTAVCTDVPAFAGSQAIETVSTNAQSLMAQNLNVAATTNEIPVAASTTPQADEVVSTDRNVQILKSIDSKYQCGAGELDKTVTRSEFANSIVTCLEALEAKIAKSPGEIPAADMAQLKEMTNNFIGEISALNNRVEAAEKKVAILQNGSNFSTTTKLVGEVIVGLSGISSQTGKPATDTNSGSIVLSNRARLNFDASFSGKDRLRTRLESRNSTPFNGAAGNGGTGTNTTRLGWDGDEGNTTNLSLLQYTLPVFNGSKLTIDALGSEFNENVYTFNPLLAAAGTGALTRFGRFNPVYRQSANGTGVTLDHKFSNTFTGSIGYAIPPGIANNPAQNAGVFGGNYAALAQLRYQAAPNLDLGLSYGRSYHSAGTGVTAATGSAFANNPFNGLPTVANHYSFSASSKLSPGFVLSGWVGLTNASAETGGTVTGSADIFNAAITAAFPDFGSKGNTLGFILGIPPKVSSISSSVPALTGRFNPESALHLEALYKVRLSDNIDITPGVLLVTSPESTATVTRGSEFVGTVRTTLRF
jgi:Carbohydrate-selective porin, OprB family